ncbi:hypothetical protein F5Y09DRAFT_318577 [Xylaria sp. FL1042]|nr:hypothetical protein F5Y09DRAFT_318577 [Xylaria sp. FL1042]
MVKFIRYSGLFTAHNTLAEPVEDPEQLDPMRERFSESLPSYRSRESETPTRSQSPDDPYDALQPGWREAELYAEHESTRPSKQFEAQAREERRKMYMERNPTANTRDLFWDIYKENNAPAIEIVKKRWIEQGIWKDEWSNGNKPLGGWKHEEPLRPESESESDSEAQAAPSGFSLFGTMPQSDRRKGKGKAKVKAKAREDSKQTEERRAVLSREREASRPYFQFFWQVSQERGENTPNVREFDPVTAEYSLFVNTQAYEKVKDRWIEWGIWHDRWGILPGMWWKHERPVDELLAGDPTLHRAREAERRRHGGRGPPAGGPPARGSPARGPPANLFGEPRRNIHEERAVNVFGEPRRHVHEEGGPPANLFGGPQRNVHEERAVNIFGGSQNRVHEERTVNLFGRPQRNVHEERIANLFGAPQHNVHEERAVTIFGAPQRDGHEELGSPSRRPFRDLPDGYLGRLDESIYSPRDPLSPPSPSYSDPGPLRSAQDWPRLFPAARELPQNGGPMQEDPPNADVLDHPSMIRDQERSPVDESPARDQAMNDAAGPSSPALVAPRRSKRLQEAELNEAQEAIENAVDHPLKAKATRRKKASTSNQNTASSAKPQGVSKAAGSTTRKRRARKG